MPALHGSPEVAGGAPRREVCPYFSPDVPPPPAPGSGDAAGGLAQLSAMGKGCDGRDAEAVRRQIRRDARRARAELSGYAEAGSAPGAELCSPWGSGAPWEQQAE